MQDNVNHPAHYTHGGVECIQAIKAALTQDGYEGYLAGNVIKHMWRYRNKGGQEDILKARWYINALIEFRALDKEPEVVGSFEVSADELLKRANVGLTADDLMGKTVPYTPPIREMDCSTTTSKYTIECGAASQSAKDSGSTHLYA